MKMAGKKYDVQLAQGRSKFSLVVAAVTLLGTLGTVAWIYSRPDSWIFTENSLQTANLVAELKSALQQLETELQRVRKESCPRPNAGPYGSVKSTTDNPLVIPDEAAANPYLAKLVKKLAINKEILVVVASQNVMPTLRLLVESVQRVGIRNYLIVALDKDSANLCDQLGAPVYRQFDLFTGPQKSGPISSLKFHILRDFLVLGYSVLLSDVDIVYLQNPFNFLHRDSDIEGMTDGHDNKTSYGYIDSWDYPPLGRCSNVHSTRLWVFNSGLFYLRPTGPALELLDRVYARVSKDPKLWDQDVFNEELMYPSRPGYKQLHISKRVLDYLLFMNSKTLFTFVRNDDEKYGGLKPVTIHANYHTKKFERMQAVVDYYVLGKKGALAVLPEGDP